MSSNRVFIRILSVLILVASLALLGFTGYNLYNLIKDISTGMNPMDFMYVYISVLADLFVSIIPIFTAIKCIRKPFKYWMEVLVNQTVLGLFGFLILNGTAVLIRSHFADIEAIYTFVLASVTFGMGIASAILIIRRKKVASILMFIIFAVDTVFIAVYTFVIPLFVTMGMINVVILMTVFVLELVFALITMLTKESRSELDAFLESIKKKRMYKYFVKVPKLDQTKAPEVQETVEVVDYDDSEERHVWEENGMIFSNRED